ncbi:hypothetical protein DPMN_176613 [Dreissena polymorpha]|uniref:Uncharacterized protein n=1 Tax=Dreissena polymorpha TaxID=45954 RepID=A0A9D4EBC1_DREPO|nr:hypothetical protein DPMN_176613 [Dreissena polymorpha]
MEISCKRILFVSVATFVVCLRVANGHPNSYYRLSQSGGFDGVTKLADMMCAFCKQNGDILCVERICASASRRYGTRWMFPVNDIRGFGYDSVGWGKWGRQLFY